MGRWALSLCGAQRHVELTVWVIDAGGRDGEGV